MYKDKIEIDLDVWKEIANRCETPEMTENDVLRKLFGLDSVRPLTTQSNDIIQKAGGVDWVWKGVTLPHGTELRADYSGRMYYAKIEDGKIVYNEKYFIAPSTAATAVTHNSVNGWDFWECKLPGRSNWILMKKLRKH